MKKGRIPPLKGKKYARQGKRLTHRRNDLSVGGYAVKPQPELLPGIIENVAVTPLTVSEYCFFKHYGCQTEPPGPLFIAATVTKIRSPHCVDTLTEQLKFMWTEPADSFALQLIFRADRQNYHFVSRRYRSEKVRVIYSELVRLRDLTKL